MFAFSTTLDQNITKSGAETVSTSIYNSTTEYLEVGQEESKIWLWFVIISMFLVFFGLAICVAIYTLKEKLKRKAERLKRSENFKANKIIKNNGKRKTSETIISVNPLFDDKTKRKSSNQDLFPGPKISDFRKSITNIDINQTNSDITEEDNQNKLKDDNKDKLGATIVVKDSTDVQNNKSNEGQTLIFVGDSKNVENKSNKENENSIEVNRENKSTQVNSSSVMIVDDSVDDSVDDKSSQVGNKSNRINSSKTAKTNELKETDDKSDDSEVGQVLKKVKSQISKEDSL